MFNRKNKNRDRLLQSFGEIKDAGFNFELIEKYFQGKNHSGAYQKISDKTCNDLDFDELFMYLDRTTSMVGQQYLYNKLRTIPSGSGKLAGQEELIEELSNDPDFRVDCQSQLEKLSPKDAYYICSLFQDEYIKPPKWMFVIRMLSFTSLLSLILLPINPVLIFLLFGVFIINMGIHYWNKKNVYQYLGGVPQLLKLNGVARELYKNDLLKKLNPDLSPSLSCIDKVRNRMSFIQLEAKLGDDMGTLFWAILELLKILFILEPLLLFGVLKQLDTKRKEIEEVFSFVGQIDSLISIASLRNGSGKYCIPEIVPSPQGIKAIDAYHPLIPHCIPNSINVGEKSILLTGSNMSGKTSFIRTIGINAITALTLNTCFADSFSLPRLRIYSAIRISDDLLNDKSYYFEEVLSIKEMITESRCGEANLFLLDEIYKGTNTVERISAGKAVLSALAKADNVVFVSTHDIELADLLQEEYELYHFSEIVDYKSVDFDYKLKNGKLKNRNAIRILQINDYPEEIITEAFQISKELDDGTVTNILLEPQ